MNAGRELYGESQIRAARKRATNDHQSLRKDGDWPESRVVHGPYQDENKLVVCSPAVQR